LEIADLKLIKLLAPLSISCCLVIPSHATEIEDFMSWAQLGDGSAWIRYSSNYNDTSKILEAEITHSTSGQQRLYFSDLSSAAKSVCKYESKLPGSSTMTFNGQAVKMLRWCKKYTDSSSYYLSLTPETDRGNNYVINLFKVATSPVEIQYNNEKLYFPVIGFTKAWNSAGGNAI
jgi:hypothetical protein